MGLTENIGPPYSASSQHDEVRTVKTWRRIVVVGLFLGLALGFAGSAGGPALTGTCVFDQISTGRMAVYSDDRERLMIVDGGEMTILDAETLAAIVTISLPGYVDEFGQPSISPDGLRVAASVSEREVRVWSLPEGTQIARFDISTIPSPRIYFMPSGEELIVLSGMRAELRDAGTGELLRVFEAAKRFVTVAAVSTDGTVLATGDSAGVIRLWDVSSGALTAELAAHVGYVTSHRRGCRDTPDCCTQRRRRVALGQQ